MAGGRSAQGQQGDTAQVPAGARSGYAQGTEEFDRLEDDATFRDFV
jgi:hypothetical protein